MPQNKWDQYAEPAPATGPGKWDQYAEPDQTPQPITSGNRAVLAPSPTVPGLTGPSAGDLASKAAGSFGSEMLHNLNPMNAARGLSQLAQHPVDTLTSGMSENRDKIPEDLKKGNFNDAFIHGVGGTVPVLGPMYARGLDAATANDPEEGGKAAADLVSMKAVPAIYGGVAKTLGAVAPRLAETAMRVQKIDRAYGKTPGAAIINETTGVRPQSVATSARGKLSELTPQYEALADKAPDVNIQPARDVVANATDKAAGQNAAKTVAQLGPLADHLSDPIPGFKGRVSPGPLGPSTQVPSTIVDASGNPIMNTAPGKPGPPTIAPMQPARAALGLKRGIGNDFIHNWNPETMKDVRSTAAGAYHKLDEGLDEAIPQGAGLNQRISSLIPVAKRAESTSRNTDTFGRIVQRFAPHTGALVGGIEGYRLGGLPGAVAGLALPELLANPTTQMIAARGADTGSKVLNSPITKAAARTPLLTRKRKEEEQ